MALKTTISPSRIPLVLMVNLNTVYLSEYLLGDLWIEAVAVQEIKVVIQHRPQGLQRSSSVSILGKIRDIRIIFQNCGNDQRLHFVFQQFDGVLNIITNIHTQLSLLQLLPSNVRVRDYRVHPGSDIAEDLAIPRQVKILQRLLILLRCVFMLKHGVRRRSDGIIKGA